MHKFQIMKKTASGQKPDCTSNCTIVVKFQAAASPH